METLALQRKFDLTAQEVERYRKRFSGHFGSRLFDTYVDFNKRLHREQISDWELDPNLVTNQGLDHALSALLNNGTQITTWYVTLSTTNTTPLATHTYATPGYTEIDGDDVDEATRQAWVGGSVSGQSVDNSASPVVYTGDQAFTAYGASLVGGGSGATTLADTAGGGTLWASSLFSSQKAMDVDVEIEITYTFGSADG